MKATNASEMSRFASLRALGLDDKDLALLARQGFVAGEVRSGRMYFKLRFRRDRRQVVRVIGSDPVRVEAVRRDLGELQRVERQSRQLARLSCKVRQALRASKAELAPLLAKAGYRCHGLSVRRRRGGNAGDLPE